MFVIRPATLQDIETFHQFAQRAFLGMLSLPKKPELMVDKITRSCASFQKKVKEVKKGDGFEKAFDNEIYYFILEDTVTKKAAGCCGIYAKTAVLSPSYYFQLETVNTLDREMPIPESLVIMHPIIVRNGPSEMCALYLFPEYRSENLGDLLALSRYLFIASHPHRFNDVIIARLRGFINKTTRSSPFWDGLGRHFLNITYEEALRKLEESQDFIPKFLPKYPIYLSLLPRQAQYVVQKTHPTTKPAMTILKKEGFEMTPDIDIFDAGPTMSAKTSELRTVKESVVGKVEKIVQNLKDVRGLRNVKDVRDVNNGRNAEAETEEAKEYLISNGRLDFRCCIGKLKLEIEGAGGRVSVILTKEVAETLNVKEGDEVRFIRR